MFVDRDRIDGVTELRVHGVSGTPPADMLDHPHVGLVAGDESAGFYRREWESELVSGDSARHRLEAYSWGGLTSGSWKRALWLLLLPFMLVNVAFHMTPRSPLRESVGWTVVRRVGEALQRLLALSLTLTLVMAMVGISIDLVGWQCGRVGTSCAFGNWLAFLQWPWLRDPGRRLAVTALVPVGVIILLWRLARSTWAQTEASEVPGCEPEDRDGWVTPLENRAMWNGEVQVARQRVLHVAAALSLVGVFLAVALLPLGRSPWSSLAWSRPWGWLPSSLVFAFLGLLVACAVALTRHAAGERSTPSRDDRPVSQRGSAARWVLSRNVILWVAVGLLAVVMLTSFFSAQGPGSPTARRARTVLPWFAEASASLFALQLLLVIGICGVCVLQSRRTPGGVPAVGVDTTAVDLVVTPRRAWKGLAQGVVVAAGWLLAMGFAAALILRVADVLGTPMAVEAVEVPKAKSIMLPIHIFWASAVAAGVLLVGMLVAAWLMWRLRHEQEAVLDEVKRTYRSVDFTDPEAQKRGAQIARLRVRACAGDAARSAGGWFVALAALVVVAGMVGYVVEPVWPLDPRSQTSNLLVTAGNLLMSAAVLGLLYVGRRAYASAPFRRSVGILWDLGTFWPRATHPLAPPCYAERTVPDLVRRIERIHEEGGEVVLSCHSQGTVIGAATVAALRADCAVRTSLLTYGSPLGRLYARFFPAYFGLDCLLRVGDLLLAPPGCLTAQQREARYGQQQRATWPWINLFRPTDPIGGAIFVGYPAVATDPGTLNVDDPADLRDISDDVERMKERRSRYPAHTFENGDVDWQLVDPAFAKRPGDGAYPAVLGHSHYDVEPAYAVAVRLVSERRRAGRGKYLVEGNHAVGA